MPQTIKETKPVSVKETFDLYNNVIKILLNNQNYSWKNKKNFIDSHNFYRLCFWFSNFKKSSWYCATTSN